MMITDPSLIYFACIAKGAIILAEFNSKDAALGAIAAKCLDNTPPFHSTFTHTIRSMTYTFLIDEPFVYFAICDEKLDNSEGLAFLKSVKTAFCEVSKGQKKMDNLSSHCFQGDFNPVFHQLLGPGLDHMEGFTSPVGQRMGQSGLLKSGSVHVSERSFSCGENSLTRMKNRLMGEFKIGKRNLDNKENDDNGGNGIGLSREFPLGMRKNGGFTELVGSQKAKNAWKRQVWWVLSMDLVICVLLFGVWLWVCQGFKCIADN